MDNSNNEVLPSTIEDLIKFREKFAFVPNTPPPPPPPGGMPPMDPNMPPPPPGGMPPMDPNMMPPPSDPMAELAPMLQEFAEAGKRQEQDINAMKSELDMLKQQMMDLSNKYSAISAQYSTVISIMNGGKLPAAPSL